MKLTRIALLFTAIVMIQSCKDEEIKKENSFVLGDTKISLDDAKLYLNQEDIYGYLTYRTYTITDGVPSGCPDYGCFTDFTVLLSIQVAVPYGEQFSVGNYSEYSDWPGDADHKISYWESVSSTTSTAWDATGEYSVTVRGSMEDGQIMSLGYNGVSVNLNSGIESDTRFYFKGVVNSLL